MDRMSPADRRPVGDVPLPITEISKIIRLIAKAEVARGEHVDLHRNLMGHHKKKSCAQFQS